MKHFFQLHRLWAHVSTWSLVILKLFRFLICVNASTSPEHPRLFPHLLKKLSHSLIRLALKNLVQSNPLMLIVVQKLLKQRPALAWDLFWGEIWFGQTLKKHWSWSTAEQVSRLNLVLMFGLQPQNDVSVPIERHITTNLQIHFWFKCTKNSKLMQNS